LEQVDYVPPFRGRAVHFVRKGVRFDELEIDFEALGARKQAEYDRLNQVVNYAQSPLCRQATILHYFGDQSAANCGRCDRCGRSPGWPQIKLSSVSSKTVDSKEADRSAVASTSVSNATKRSDPHSLSEEQKVAFLTEVVEAIQRMHGRVGKHLIAQYLCGSQNSKILKLNLHRLSGFGMLAPFRQADGIELIDLLLSAGLLRQQEVNRNRPTVSVSPELTDVAKRQELFAALQLPPKLQAKIIALRKRKPAAAIATPTPAPAEPPGQTRSHTEPLPLEPPAPHTTAPAAVGTGAGQVPAEAPSDSTDKPDWSWTLALFKSGNNWSEVQLIRRMSDEELAASLLEALRSGARVQRQWIAGNDDPMHSAGRTQVLREMRRQATAWVN
jgi:ATP-dependent DNA helicase RecQ